MDSKKTCLNCPLTSGRKAPKLSPFRDWIVAKKIPPKIPQPTRVQGLWDRPADDLSVAATRFLVRQAIWAYSHSGEDAVRALRSIRIKSRMLNNHNLLVIYWNTETYDTTSEHRHCFRLFSLLSKSPELYSSGSGFGQVLNFGSSSSPDTHSAHPLLPYPLNH
jgi:hypothetical protein